MRNFVLRETRHLASLLQREKVARFTAADEVSITLIALSRQRTHLIHARLPCLGDADRVCFANRSIPAFIAGVQTMRARICSAFSCDMFARVV